MTRTVPSPAVKNANPRVKLRSSFIDAPFRALCFFFPPRLLGAYGQAGPAVAAAVAAAAADNTLCTRHWRSREVAAGTECSSAAAAAAKTLQLIQ